MQTAIHIENLSVSFDDTNVLKNISFDIHPGEIVGYIGPNGAGKSTTIKSLLGIVTPQQGEILIDGVKIDGNNNDYKTKIGYVPEAATLYESLRGREYLTFVGSLYNVEHDLLARRIDTMTKVFGIKEDLDNLISSYSKGMKQKLLIISSMLHDPDILIFDEPINGMDAGSVKIFKEIMVSLIKSGKTIMYSSHLMDIVEKVSTRIIILKEGQIVVDDSLENLKSKENTSSLETIFNDITGFDSYADSATDFMDALGEHND